MKKVFLFLTCILLAVCNACKDDDEKVTSLNGNYSNIGSYQGENRLSLYYGEAEEIGKDVFFNTSDGKIATLVLNDIIPGQLTTEFKNIPLKGDGRRYEFAASEEKEGWAVTIAGEVIKGMLTIKVNGKMPSNEWIGTWNPAKMPLFINWESTTPIQIDLLGTGKPVSMPVSAAAPLLANMLGEKITNLLQDITFKEDGNILATYLSRKGEGEAWQESPVNLVKFYVKENRLHIYLNAYMVQKVIGSRQTRLDLEGMESLILKLREWALYGIPLSYTVIGERGKIFLDATDITPSLGEILEVLLPFLSDQDNFAQLLKTVLVQLPIILRTTTQLEAGINLVKATGL